MTTNHDVPERQDALGLLRREHRRLEELLERLKNAGDDDREAVLAALSARLREHVDATEGIFYPAVREAARDRGERGGGGPTLNLLVNGVRQHNELLRLLDGLAADLTGAATGAATGAKELDEQLHRHFDDEETGIMTAAEDLLDDRKLLDLGRRMAEREQVIQAQEELAEEVQAAARTWLRWVVITGAALLAALAAIRRLTRQGRSQERHAGERERRR